MRRAIFAGFIDGLFNSSKGSKQEQINIYENDYEPYQFEEELEEDDYYEDDNEK